jgi:type II secretory pathway component PulF
MAFFLYQAFSKDGRKVGGVVEANSQQIVRDQLLAKNLYVVSVTVQTDDNSPAGFIQRFFEPAVTLKDKIFFTKQLAVLIKSGIALADALELMVDQSPKYMHKMLSKMCDGLKEGTGFAQVLSMYPKSFPPLYVQLVRAGEASGQMEKILLRLAAFLEEQEEFNKAVAGAVRGPFIQLGLIFVIAGFLLTLIVPKITGVLSSMGGKALPTITRVVMGMSDALINHYPIVIGVVLLIIVIYKAWQQTRSGRLFTDNLKLKVPVVRHFTRTTAVVQFSQTLGLLLESGVNIAEALDIVVQIVSNQILIDALKTAKDNIIKQGRVTEYLKRTNLFSAVDIHLIGTGEQSGALDSMLIQVGNYNQDDLRQFAQGLTALLNPISMVILTAVVGTIIFAVMAPLMDMSSMMS